MKRKSLRKDASSQELAGKGASRRKVLKAGAAGIAAALASTQTGIISSVAASPSLPLPPPFPDLTSAPDLILFNGNIHTMASATGDPVVSAVSIRAGRLVEVGTVTQAPGPATRVVNLQGRTVVPGIIEPHIHIVSLANRPGYHVPTENARSILEMQEALAARRPDVPPGQWITSMGGWVPNMFGRTPTLADLDAAVPDRPVFMFQGFTGPGITNTLGKQFFETAVSPLAGPVTVSATGLMTAGAMAERALYHLRVLQTFEDKLRSTRDAMKYSVSTGLTSALDQTLFPIPGPFQPSWMLSNLDGYRMYDSWLQVHRDGGSIMRLQTNFLHNQNLAALPELRDRIKNQFQFFGDDMMSTGAIGEWALPIGSAASTFATAHQLLAEAQWRNENAPDSAAQIDTVINAYEAVDATYGIKDLRWVVHHVAAITATQLNRLKAMNCGVVMRGFNWISGTGTASGAPFRRCLDSGIKAALEGDGVHISTLIPWPHMQYAVTGVNLLGAQINPLSQCLTRLEALRAFTREAAWFLRMEDKTGTIEAGKLADLVVLNNDYFTVPEADIRKIRSIFTVVDGKVVHETGVLV